MTTENGVDLDQFQWKDFGIVHCDGVDGDAAFTAIKQEVSAILNRDISIDSLGGGHAVSKPVILAHVERFPKLNIPHIDTHSDLHNYFEEKPHSHASPFARLMEMGNIGRLVQVGTER